MNFKSLQSPSKKVFITDQEIQDSLTAMEQDSGLNTGPIMVRDADTGRKTVGFRDRHTNYLKEHPKVNPEYYLSNLRTVIRIRASK